MSAVQSSKFNEGRLAQVLVAPIVSEKGTMVAEKHNQVLFKVLRDATKPEIKAAVELMFKVEVQSVSTVVQKGKVKRFGKSTGRRDHVKKAYVALKPGQSLQVGRHEFVFVGVDRDRGPNYVVDRGHVRVLRNGRELTVLNPEKRAYASGGGVARCRAGP